MEKATDTLKKASGFIGEFKTFISRGNVVDLAVGVVVGSAFTTIVNSLVNDLIMPIVGYIIGGIDFTDFKFTFPAVEGVEPAVFAYGSFLQNVVNFLIISFVVFLLVKFINKFRAAKEEEPKEEPAPTADIVLLTEIRDLLKEQNPKD